ncbi:MAG: ATP-binding cassette domain-containing protein [Gammaproteobacteria bacterium]|jgi:ATP-binding cassette subfamily F protein uup|nr:ATP-binding cassette domain-containing protein [Gammaproteobacteria bacterium]
MNLMRLEQVHLAYGAAPLLDGVELQIDMGDRICLIGRNGAGKSSLIKVLSGEQPADAGTVWRSPACRIGYLQQDLPEREDLLVAEVVAMGLADVYALRQQHSSLTSQELDAAGMRKLEQISHQLDELDGWQMENQVERILSRLQLDGERPLSELSGGWRRRVSLARALVSEPTLLLLDEPTNHLDLLAIEWLEQQLLSYTGAIVFITHDRRFLQALANRIMELDRGQLHYFPGDYERFLAYREQQLLEEQRHNALFDKKLAQEEVWIRQGIKARRTRNEGRVRALQDLRKQRSQRRERQGRVNMQVAAGQDSGKQVCEIQQVTHGYGQQPLLQDFNFTLMKGDRVGLVGANGVGKSTLLRILLGELTPQSGKVTMGTRLQVAYFDQLRDQLELDKTVMDNLAEGRESIEINGKQKHVMGYLGDFLFAPQRVRSPVSSLSGGERNRLLLAKLFSKPANVLVLDEPTNDLDIETLELLEELLADYQGTVLLVSHDRVFLDQVVTSCLVFDGQGNIEESVGGYSDWHGRGGRLQSALARSGQAGQALSLADTEVAKPVAAKQAKKLSYKVQREFDQLPGLIEALEAELAALQSQVGEPDFYHQEHTLVTAKLAELNDKEIALETAMERWMEIEEMLA